MAGRADATCRNDSERAMATPRVCGVLPLINQSMLRSNAAPPTKNCRVLKNICQLLGKLASVGHIYFAIAFFIFNQVVGNEVSEVLVVVYKFSIKVSKYVFARLFLWYSNASCQ